MSAIAQLKALFGIDTKQAEGAIDNIGNKVKQLGSHQLAGLKSMIAGAFTTGAIVAFGRDALQTMTRIKDLSIQAGVSTDEFQGLSMVIRKAGADENQLATALAKVENAQQDALAGLTPMVAAFKSLGISQEDLIRMNPAELFVAMSKSLADANMTGEPLMATMNIIGAKVAPQLKQSMQDLANIGLQAAIDKSKELGESFDKDIIEKAKKIDDQIEGLKRRARVGFMESLFGAGEGIQRMIQSGGIIGAIKRLFQKSGGPVLGLDEWTGQPEGAGRLKGMTETGVLTDEQQQRKLLADKSAATRSAEQAKLDAKRSEQVTENEKRRDDLYRQQDELAMSYAEKQRDILSGKGTPLGAAARVDSLQAMGGLVGGAASGPADRAARMAERQLKINEEMKQLAAETNRKLDDLGRKLDDLGGVD